MKNESCVLLSWVIVLLLLLINSEPTVAPDVYRNNEYEVSEIDKRIAIPKPDLFPYKHQHTGFKRQQINLLEQSARKHQHPPNIKRHPTNLAEHQARIHARPSHRQSQHVGLRRQEIIHALNEDNDKVDSEEDIESLGRRIDQTGNEIKDVKPISVPLPDKHTAAATRYIISKIKEIQEKLFKRTENKDLEAKLNQMATSVGKDTKVSNVSSSSVQNTTLTTAEVKNITVDNTSHTEKKEINTTKAMEGSDNVKPQGDGSKVPDRRKIIPEEVVDKILEKFQQLKQEAKHIAVSESRHSVEHAEEKGWRNVATTFSSKHGKNRMTRKMAHVGATLNISNKLKDGKKRHRSVLPNKKKEKKKKKRKKKHRRKGRVNTRAYFTLHGQRLIPTSGTDTQGTKRTFTVLDNGRALLNYKSGIVAESELPPVRENQQEDIVGQEETFSSLQAGLHANPYAQFTTKAGVALPNLPPTFVVYNEPEKEMPPANQRGLQHAPMRTNFLSNSRLTDPGVQNMPWQCPLPEIDCEELISQAKQVISLRQDKQPLTKQGNTMNFGLSSTMGIPPSAYNSQMTVFGNEEKSLLNMISGIATRDLPPDEPQMADALASISSMESGGYNKMQPQNRASISNMEANGLNTLQTQNRESVSNIQASGYNIPRAQNRPAVPVMIPNGYNILPAQHRASISNMESIKYNAPGPQHRASISNMESIGYNTPIPQNREYITDMESDGYNTPIPQNRASITDMQSNRYNAPRPQHRTSISNMESIGYTTMQAQNRASISGIKSGGYNTPIVKNLPSALNMDANGYYTPTAQNRASVLSPNRSPGSSSNESPGSSTNRSPDQMLQETGVAFHDQKPIIFKHNTHLQAFFDGKDVNFKRHQVIPSINSSTYRAHVPLQRHVRSIKSSVIPTLKRSNVNNEAALMPGLINLENEAQLFSNEVLHDIPPITELNHFTGEVNSFMHSNKEEEGGGGERGEREVEGYPLENRYEHQVTHSSMPHFSTSNVEIPSDSSPNSPIYDLRSLPTTNSKHEDRTYHNEDGRQSAVEAANTIAGALQTELGGIDPSIHSVSNNPYAHVDKELSGSSPRATGRDERRDYNEKYNNNMNPVNGLFHTRSNSNSRNIPFTKKGFDLSEIKPQLNFPTSQVNQFFMKNNPSASNYVEDTPKTLQATPDQLLQLIESKFTSDRLTIQ